MGLRLDVQFDRPLGRADKIALAVAAAALAKVRSVRYQRGDRGAWIFAEALGTAALAAALREVGLNPAAITTSLADESGLDDLAEQGGERVRAIGR